MAEQKKKRAYAAQAYDFGANSVGSAPPAPYNPGMGAPMQQGIPQQGFPSQQGFVPQGAPQQGFQPGIQPQSPIDPLAQGFGQMNIGGQPQQVTPQAQAPGHVNPLLTTDLVTQPFHVLELEVCWVYAFSGEAALIWNSNLLHRLSYLPMYVLRFLKAILEESVSIPSSGRAKRCGEETVL